METKDMLTMIGWPISCVLSILAGGIVIPKLTQKRRVLAWGVLSETDLIPKSVQTAASLPISIQIGDHSPKSVSIVRLRIGNAGNEVLENVAAALTINKTGRVLNIKASEELGEYANHVKWEIAESKAVLRFDFINPAASVDFEFLLSDYEGGSFVLDSTGPGVQVRRRESNNWELGLTVAGVMVSALNGRPSPSAEYLGDIAAELKALRRLMQERQ